MGKCVSARSVIDDPVTGDRRTIEECVRRRQAAGFGMSAGGAVRVTAVADWIDSGVQPCYRVTTRTGRSVEVTGHHPFFTVQGWRPLCGIRTGTPIAVPAALPAFGQDESWPRDLVRLLAYFIAEGGLTDHCPEFTNTDPALIVDYAVVTMDALGLDGVVITEHDCLWSESDLCELRAAEPGFCG